MAEILLRVCKTFSNPSRLEVMSRKRDIYLQNYLSVGIVKQNHLAHLSICDVDIQLHDFCIFIFLKLMSISRFIVNKSII